MSAESVTDYEGKPLSEGDRVAAWLDGVRYGARVKKIEPRAPAGYRSVILIREDDHTEVRSFSDAVVVVQPSHLWSCGCLKNNAGAHRAGCPDHPEGVRGS